MKKNDRRKRKLQEEACDYEIERTPTTRYEPDYEEGLTSAQAEEHRRDGWGNISVDPPAQTTEEIIKENVFTYFNLIFLVLAILLIIVGSFRNLTFLPVIIFNTLIGIIQEIRSKRHWKIKYAKCTTCNSDQRRKDFTGQFGESGSG